jgi:hypothetical protein
MPWMMLASGLVDQYRLLMMFNCMEWAYQWTKLSLLANSADSELPYSEEAYLL